MEFLGGFTAGLITGISATLAIIWLGRKDSKAIASEMLEQTQTRKERELETVIERLKESFSAISLSALSKNTEDFLKLAHETLRTQTVTGEKELESKKRLIDRSVETIGMELNKLHETMSGFEKDRRQKFGELSAQMTNMADTASKLHETTNQLKIALSGTKTRGQWGERMAEDVLRLSGMIEGVNYKKQKTLDDSSGRPDYTFFLPRNLVVNMDVKFPFDNYLRWLEAENAPEKESHKAQFLKDVRARIKEASSRSYINPDQSTLDYTIIFIPNEQVYGFINSSDTEIIDEALKNKVILCSPLTLYAVLAVIRQSVDNFHLEQSASRMLGLMGAFHKQWAEFTASMDRMGKKLEEAQKEFGHLISTRRNQLERPLEKIEELRIQKGIELQQLAEDGKRETVNGTERGDGR